LGKIYAGTSGWAYPAWKPGFYPAKLASAKFLGHYATRLNSVEVNYTFRRYVTAKLLGGWIAATPADFQFAVKAHQNITHIKRLREAAEQTASFFATLAPLREAGKLGPALFQLPPFLKCDLERLKEFIGTLPRDVRAAMEFRHVSWFSDEVYEALRNANVALCVAESEKIETPDVTTADFSYLRMRKADYSASARREVSKRVATARARGDVFVYFKHEDTPDGAFCAEELLRDGGAG
jgi:uncharacterized protein YecE (DUF72 family)